MITKQEFESFTLFALRLIEAGQAESLPQLLEQWEAQREHEQVMDDIQQGIDDADAGVGRPAHEVIRDVRKHVGLAP